MTLINTVRCLSHFLDLGDFEEIYGGEPDPEEPQAGQWDAIMTCFFIDTVRASYLCSLGIATHYGAAGEEHSELLEDYPPYFDTRRYMDQSG